MTHQSHAAPALTINGCTITGRASPHGQQGYPKPIQLFYGIPYASAKRLASPEPIALDASSLGPSLDATWPSARGRTVQGVTVNNTTNDGVSAASSPHLLLLHIIRPAAAAATTATSSSQHSDEGREIPVVVYFHGGSFNFGTPLDGGDMASFVANANRDIIVVCASYRLGALGFAVSEEGELNLGLRDQRAAVEWTHRWISEFGGNPHDITLRGVSAGAHSVTILESGSPTSRSILSPTHPRIQSQMNDFCSMVPQFLSSPAEPKAEAIERASFATYAKHDDALTWPFQPVIDGPGGTIPDLPLRLWQQKQQQLHPPLPPVITGFCSHEGIDFIFPSSSSSSSPPPTFRSFFSNLIPSLTSTHLDDLESLYPAQNYPSPSRRIGEAYGHYAYICPIIHTAHSISSSSSRSSSTNDDNQPPLVYLYEFAALTSLASSTAAHASHTDYLTLSMYTEETQAFQATGKAMHKRWCEFITTPDGRIDEAEWPAFETPFGEDPMGTGEMLVFGQGNDESIGGANRGVPVRTRTITEREKEVCVFWWDKMELSQGDGVRGSAH